VFVDFIQIVNESGRSERDAVNKISAGLPKLAKRENVPVVVASQLTRPNNHNVNEKPILFHLRESGNLEQDAHSVLLIYRPMDTNTNEFTGEDQIIIAKQRHGPVGNIPVTYNDRQLTFEARRSDDATN
jgi:replicative DNA helicase